MALFDHSGPESSPNTEASTRATPSSSWPGARWSAAVTHRGVGVGHGVRRPGPREHRAGRWACRRRRSPRRPRRRGRRRARARVVALVTPAALISSSADAEDQVITARSPTAVGGAVPELLVAELLVAGQQLERRLGRRARRSARGGCRRGPGGARRNYGSRSMPASVSTANALPGRLPGSARRPRGRPRARCRAGQHRPVAGDVPDERAVGDRRPGRAGRRGRRRPRPSAAVDRSRRRRVRRARRARRAPAGCTADTVLSERTRVPSRSVATSRGVLVTPRP